MGNNDIKVKDLTNTSSITTCNKIMILTNEANNTVQNITVNDFTSNIISSNSNNALEKGSDDKFYISDPELITGALNNLTTTDKTSLVGAINEVVSTVASLPFPGGETLHALKGYLDNGTLLSDSELYNAVYSYNHSTFDATKFTTNGSPTITSDGIASGFSDSNYLRTIKVGTLNSNSFKIKIPFNLTNASQQGVLLSSKLAGSTEFGLATLVNNSKVLAYFSSNGTDWDIGAGGGTTTLQSNTDYLLEISFTGSQYLVELTNLSTETKNTELTISSTSKIYNGNNLLCIGYQGWNALAYGSIDLKKFSITVDGVEVFNGNKNGLDVIKPDNYTVVGTPTISADGVASGFMYSPEADLIQNIDFSNINSFVIKGRYYNTTGSGRNQAIFELYDTVNNITKMRFGVQTNGTTSTFYYPDSDTTVTNNQNLKTITVNTWNDFKIVYDGTNVGVYINDMTTSVFNVAVTKSWYQHPMQLWIGLGSNQQAWLGFIDLNLFKIYVDGDLVYQPCLKIPYTESSTGSKIVDAAYRTRVESVYETFGSALYYTIDEDNKNVTLPFGEVYGFIEQNKEDVATKQTIGDWCLTKPTTDSTATINKPATVKENYLNGTSGYIVHSDGLIIQWGQGDTTNNSCSLLKPFSDTNYALFIRINQNNSGAGFVSAYYYANKSTDKFEKTINATSAPFDWVAIGY